MDDLVTWLRARLDDDEREINRHPGDGFAWGADEPYAGDVLIKLLALPYADRDGYREEWRP